MANDGKLSLEVLIRTIADSRGIKASEEDIKTYQKTLEGAAKSGQVLDTSADKIEQGLRDQARAAGAASDTLKDTGKAASTSANQLNELKRSGGEVSQILSGLQNSSEGGTRGLLGMLTAGRGIVGMFRSMGSVLAGPVGIGLAAAAAGIAYLGKITGQNQATIERWYAQAAKDSAAMKASYAEMDEAAKKSLDSQLAKVSALTAAYQELLGMMEAANQRNAKLNDLSNQLANAQVDREEQLALAKAGTPEERAKIAERFATKREAVKKRADEGALINDQLGAGVQRKNALETISQQQRLIDAANVDATGKRGAFDFFKRQADTAIAEHGIGSSQANIAITDSKTAKHALDLAETNRVKITQEATKAIDAAQAQIDTANFTEQSVAIQKEILQATQEASGLKKINEQAGAKIESTAAAEAGVSSAADEKARLEEALGRRSGLSTDAGNADLVRGIAAANARLEKQNAELLSITEKNAAGQLEASRAHFAQQKALATEQAKIKRQQANAPVSPYY